uniref:Rab-GAP TBC domain-containing protein n=1 Tax=Palpitomonas bilix TaxID=652834 RepID=A0A7S3D404_9EUKA
MKKIMKQVEKDIRRTTVNAFVNDDAKLESLRRILLAYSRRNVSVGYCQSMNSIAAALLMHMEEELAFWGLVTVVEELSPGYYTEHLVGYQVDERVLGDLLREKLPELGAIMTKWEFKLSWVTTQWFLGTFMNAVKLDPALRVLDCYFAEGVAALLRLGLAIFKICAPAMVSQDTAEEAMMQIRLFTQRMNEDDMNRAILIAYNDIGHLPEDHIHELQLQHTQDVLNEVKRRQKERESEVVKTERKLASLLRASLRLEMLHKDIFYTEPLTPLLAVYPLFGRVIAERKRSSSLPGVDSSLADVRREIEAAAMAAAPPLHPHSKTPLPTSNMNSRGNGSARRGSGSDGNGSTGSGGSGHEGGGGGAGGGDMGGSGGHGSVTVPSSPHTKKQGRGHRKNRTITEGAAPKQGGNTFSLSHISEARADEDSLHAVWQEVHNTMETIRKLYDSQIMVEHQRSSFKDRDLILRPFTAPTSQLDVFDMGRLKARKEEIEKELSERKEKEKEREGREEGGSSSVRNTDAMDSNQEGSTKMRENGEKQPVRKSTKELELEVNRINLIFDILPMVEPGPFIFCFSFRKRIMNTLDEVAREMNELLPSAPLLDECLATIRDCINKLAERNVLLGKLSHKEAARIAGEKAALAASLGAQGILFATEGGFGLIGRSMAKLSLDDDYVQLRKKKFATIQDFRGGIKGGAEAFGRGIWGGVSGIFLQPIRGARARGVEGFFRGVGLGLAGIITKPIGGVVDLAAFTTEGLRSGAIYNGNDIRTLHARGKSHTFVREQIGQMLGKRGNSEIDVVNDEKGAVFDVENTFKPPRRLSV